MHRLYSLALAVIAVLTLCGFEEELRDWGFGYRINDIKGNDVTAADMVAGWGYFHAVWIENDHALYYTFIAVNGSAGSSHSPIFTSGFRLSSPGILLTGKRLTAYFSKGDDGKRATYCLQKGIWRKRWGEVNRITPRGYSDTDPSIAYNGHVMGYTCLRSEAGQRKSQRIIFQIIDGEGNLQGEPLTLGRGFNPVVASNGEDFGVCWLGMGRKSVVFQAISGEGDISGNPVTVLTLDRKIRNLRMVAGADGEWAISFDYSKSGGETRQVYFARLRSNGRIIKRANRISRSSGEAICPSLAWDRWQEQYWIFWTDSRQSELEKRTEIYFSILSKTGKKIVSNYPALFLGLFWDLEDASPVACRDLAPKGPVMLMARRKELVYGETYWNLYSYRVN